ncbi:MAG: cyclic nucleotide-binding domain-containing protein [Gammaproteobacteria bacterium]|nr:cyclic nucleotide-binding domain-containing protein [Gammaproteobacteria bacterium]MDH5594327.1 cyclic nucleotide-binding domain-containing protein [Gammaproteobacteria bacterium]
MEDIEQQNHVDVDTLSSLEPLSALSEERIRELADEILIEYVDADITLFSEGDIDNQVIYLISGELELRTGMGTCKLISAGTEDSWHPLDPKQPRQTTAMTLSPVEIIRIDQDKLDTYLTWDQVATGDDAHDEDHPDGTTKNWTSNVTPSATFSSLPPANIKELFARMESINVKNGDVIIKQGDPGDYYYLIKQGQAKVTRQQTPDSEPVELAILGEGNNFGEEALISNKPRNANVIMITDGVLMRLAKNDFVELLQEPMIEKITLDQTLESIQDNGQCIDVRVPSEYEQGHLPGSISMPLNELRQRAAELDKNLNYICYCNTGRRSSAAAFLLAQYGLHASVLKDGVQGLPNSYMIR